MLRQSPDDSEFNMEEWLARSWWDAPFGKCVRDAANMLSFGRDELRERLFGALICLCFCDSRDVPAKVRPDFEEIEKEIQRRAGADLANPTLFDADLDRLRKSIRRCKVRTAERIAKKIIELDRKLAAE